MGECLRFISLLVLVNKVILPVWSLVTETTKSYTCSRKFHHVEYQHAVENPDCEQYWSIEDHSIGTFLNSIPECHTPCRELTAGRIVLTDCLNITVAVICTGDYLTEYRVHFYGEKIPSSTYHPVNRNHIGVFLIITLLLLVIVCLVCAGRSSYQ